MHITKVTLALATNYQADGFENLHKIVFLESMNAVLGGDAILSLMQLTAREFELFHATPVPCTVIQMGRNFPQFYLQEGEWFSGFGSTSLTFTQVTQTAITAQIASVEVDGIGIIIHARCGSSVLEEFYFVGDSIYNGLQAVRYWARKSRNTSNVQIDTIYRANKVPSFDISSQCLLLAETPIFRREHFSRYARFSDLGIEVFTSTGCVSVDFCFLEEALLDLETF